MQKQTLYMETTQIHPSVTAAQIVNELVKMGATQVNTEYRDTEIVGLRWIMRVNGHDRVFSMPVRIAAIEAILLKRVVRRTKDINRKIKEQSRRVAWRQLLRWVQAQMCMIECGMAEREEIFFPYLQHPETGRTVFEHFRETGFRALPAPSVKQ